MTKVYHFLLFLLPLRGNATANSVIIIIIPLLCVVHVSELFEVEWPRGPNSSEFDKIVAWFISQIVVIIKHVKLSLAW